MDVSNDVMETTLSPFAEFREKESNDSSCSEKSSNINDDEEEASSLDEDNYDENNSQYDENKNIDEFCGSESSFSGIELKSTPEGGGSLASENRQREQREEDGYIEELVLVPREQVQSELNSRKIKYIVFFICFGVASMVGLIVLMIVLGSDENKHSGEYVVGFGSCTSYDMRDQPIWTAGVIPSAIDAWIWAGDVVYLDDPSVNCDMHPESSQCNCETDWLVSSPHGCMAGDSDYARERWQASLSNPNYMEFMEYMCPGALAQGMFPPPGTDPKICPRPIIGIYDDHDFGYNNANHRLPDKQTFKNMYLDAVGESKDSVRRSQLRGAYDRFELSDNIDVFLLDERYDRDTLPCWTRRPYCEKILSVGPTHSKYTWCFEFLNTSDVFGIQGVGSCCDKDERLFLGWCKSGDVNGVDEELRAEACDPMNEKFGTRMLYLSNDDKTLSVEPPSDDWLDSEQSTPMCEVLGRTQRSWLKQNLAASQAKLKLIVSPSVVMSNPVWQDATVDGETVADAMFCSGDDLDCYSAAQAEILSLAATTQGCTLLLTGDYHWTDIKVLSKDTDVYGVQDYISPKKLSKEGLIQVMSSGLTESTSPNETCTEFYARGYTVDRFGLREQWSEEDDYSDNKHCSILVGGSFATVHVTSNEDRELEEVAIKLRDRNGDVKYTKVMDISSCANSHKSSYSEVKG